MIEKQDIHQGINKAKIKYCTLFGLLMAFISFLPNQLHGQDGQENFIDRLGAKIGLHLSIGSKINRIGLNTTLFYTHDFVQVNLGGTAFYALNSWGPNAKRLEGQLGSGITVGFGKKQVNKNEFVSLIGNQTSRPFGLSYAYKWYFDNIETSQKTGLIGFHIKNFCIVDENDFFAGKGKDRFRTNGFTIIYHYEDWQIAANTIFWTCDADNPRPKKVTDSLHPACYGYYDITDSKYKELSHGVLTLQVSKAFDWRQTARAEIGIDAEQIRNLMQNEIIHNSTIIKDCHYPMLDKNNEPYLPHKQDEYKQDIRDPKFFWGLSLNPNLFF